MIRFKEAMIWLNFVAIKSLIYIKNGWERIWKIV